MNRAICRVFQVIIVLCFYIVPYVFLAKSQGFELFISWTILTLLTGIVSLVDLWKKR